VLRKKLTPNFRIGCKRILISRDYLRSLTNPNVEVVTEGIVEVRENAVVTADGVAHEVDAIIFGTGFKVTEMPFADTVTGRSGMTLNEGWKGSPQAHLGALVKDFPNLFIALGPNTGLGHTSVVLMIEAQLKLVVEAIQHMHANGLDLLEVKPEAQQKFVDEVDAAMKGTVWTDGGCQSWYLDKTGRNSTLWPSFTFSFMQKSHFRPEEYVMTRRRDSKRRPRAQRGLASVLPLVTRMASVSRKRASNG
jgi:cation diffusion facilitator CzcD-associated flavoprotein CzcO